VTSEVAHESYSFQEPTRNTYLRNHASQLMPCPQIVYGLRSSSGGPRPRPRYRPTLFLLSERLFDLLLATIADHKSHHLQCDLAATRAGLVGARRLGRSAFANDPETRLGDGLDRPAMTQHAHGQKMRGKQAVSMRLFIDNLLALGGQHSHGGHMFTVSEEEAAAIRTAFDHGGEFAAAVELRRRFPGITDYRQARQCARAIAGWTPQKLPPRPTAELRRLPKRAAAGNAESPRMRR
jgi:hypothetical protein